MAKRGAEDDGIDDSAALKSGERPVADAQMGDGEDFEDEFEDEFESEDEIMEAGVDGRPDEEREAEERASGLSFYEIHLLRLLLTSRQAPWRSIEKHSYRAGTN